MQFIWKCSFNRCFPKSCQNDEPPLSLKGKRKHDLKNHPTTVFLKPNQQIKFLHFDNLFHRHYCCRTLVIIIQQICHLDSCASNLQDFEKTEYNQSILNFAQIMGVHHFHSHLKFNESLLFSNLGFPLALFLVFTF